MDGLNSFRSAFKSTCEKHSFAPSTDSLGQIGAKDLRPLVLDLVSALQNLPVSRQLSSNTGRGSLSGDLSRLYSEIDSELVDVDRLIPLLRDVINKEPDEIIFTQAYAAVTESTPPPRPVSSVQQTPWLHNTSSFANSSEHRKYVDDVLKEELGPLYVGIPGFYERFFGEISRLTEISIAVFQKCQEGNDPLFCTERGWRDWPKSAQERDVLKWIAKRIELFLDFAKDLDSAPNTPRRPLARPNMPLQGSTAERKLDIGFVDDPKASADSTCHWSQILVPGELKSNPSLDTASKAWLDLGRYVREVLAAQDTRRFCLGFTICGSVMRLWEFDRVGGIASPPFDINKDGQQFVSVMLGFLWMNQEQLGFDPTIVESDGVRYMEITRNGKKERLILDGVMRRAPCIAGRATTCWKVYRDGDGSKTPLIVKDSWQFPERGEEGELLREATEKGVVNVTRHYHHETVRVGGIDDDVEANIRKRLDISKATNYISQNRKTGSSMMPPTPTSQSSTERGRSANIPVAMGRKRSSNFINMPLPSSKRQCSSSPTKQSTRSEHLNRVHRRVIVQDYGKPIYMASSRAGMLAALVCCIEGYESLYLKAGILQRDISIGNLMMNEDNSNPSWPAFLIDLDLAIKEQRQGSSGALGKTGTRAFMAIGALLDERHSFMHDCESFFWVLFWICIHHDGMNKERRTVQRFDKWNYVDAEELAGMKLGVIADEDIFRQTAYEHFTEYHQPLIPWINRLRRAVFPGGRRWKDEDRRLYSQMKEILGEAQKDPNVLAE